MKKLGFSNGHIKTSTHINVATELSDLKKELEKPYIEKIVNDFRKTGKQETKESLPLVMANFGREGKSKEGGFYNGVIPLDVDARKDLTTNEKYLLQTATIAFLDDSESALLYYISPSGNGGVKAFISIGMNPLDYDAYFDIISRDYYKFLNEYELCGQMIDLVGCLEGGKLDKRDSYNPQFACYEMVNINEDAIEYPTDPDDLKFYARANNDDDINTASFVSADDKNTIIDKLNYTENDKQTVLDLCFDSAMTETFEKGQKLTFVEVADKHKHNDFIFNFYKWSSYNGLDLATVQKYLIAWSSNCYDKSKMTYLYKKYGSNHYFGKCLIDNNLCSKLERNTKKQNIELSEKEFISDYIPTMKLAVNKRLAITAPTAAGKTTAFNAMMSEIKKTEPNNISIVVLPTLIMIKRYKNANPNHGTYFGKRDGKDRDFEGKDVIYVTYKSVYQLIDTLVRRSVNIDAYADEVHIFPSNKGRIQDFNNFLNRTDILNRFYTFTATPLKFYHDKRMHMKTIAFTKLKNRKPKFVLMSYPEGKRTEAMMAEILKNNDEYVKHTEIIKVNPQIKNKVVEKHLPFTYIILEDKTLQLDTILRQLKNEELKYMIINSDKDENDENSEDFQNLASDILIPNDVNVLITTSVLQNGLSIGFENPRDIFGFYLKTGDIEMVMTPEELHQIFERARDTMNAKNKMLYFLYADKKDKKTIGQCYLSKIGKDIEKAEDEAVVINEYILKQTDTDENFNPKAYIKKVIEDTRFTYHKTVVVNYLMFGYDYYITDKRNCYNDLNKFKERMENLKYEVLADKMSDGSKYSKVKNGEVILDARITATDHTKDLEKIFDYLRSVKIDTVRKYIPKNTSAVIEELEYFKKVMHLAQEIVKYVTTPNGCALLSTLEVIAIIERNFVTDAKKNITDHEDYFTTLKMLNLIKVKKTETKKDTEDKAFITNILNLKEGFISSAKDFKTDVLLKNGGDLGKRLEVLKFFVNYTYKDDKVAGKAVKSYFIGSQIEHSYRIKPEWESKNQKFVK